MIVNNQKNKLISYIYLGISLLIFLIGLFGLFFISKINNFAREFQIPEINPKESHLFMIVFGILIVLGLLLAMISINVLRMKRWANLLLEIINWFFMLFMIIFTSGYMYFVINIDKIYNIRNKGVVVAKFGALSVSVVYILLILFAYYINKQLRLLRRNY